MVSVFLNSLHDWSVWSYQTPYSTLSN